jgi:serine/threonine protein kinase
MRDLIPRYTILEEIGRSDKATVYLADSAAMEQVVALKVANRILRDNDSCSALFAREYAAMSVLRHPSVVDIHDYGVHDGLEYLAMEYFPRGDLKARLMRRISESESLHYLREIAASLNVVHQAGLLHRDLKPPNVMLRDNDQVVLIDFGLAFEVASGLRSTHTGVLRGSPYYMSPEQALGEELGPKADLYSLGVILYEMLTGVRPFDGISAIEVLEQHVNLRPGPLPSALSHLQPLMDALLAKSPRDRLDSAAQVAEVAEGFLAHDPGYEIASQQINSGFK